MNSSEGSLESREILAIMSVMNKPRIKYSMTLVDSLPMIVKTRMGIRQIVKHAMRLIPSDSSIWNRLDQCGKIEYRLMIQ